MCKTLPRESLSPMRIKKVFGQKGTRPLTPREKSWLLAMTWWKESMKEGSRTGFRPAEPTSSAEQPQGLPAVIAELTRWAALELTFKSEINVGSRLSEKGRLKRRITECNTTRGEPSACAKEEANQSEWRQGREETRKRNFRACKQQATTAEKLLRASL